MDEKTGLDIMSLQARWNKLRVANVYDTLDQMGYPNQCIDLGIKPLVRHQHLAGVALTVQGRHDPRDPGKISRPDPLSITYDDIRAAVFPGAVIVIAGGGGDGVAKFGEMTSWGFQQKGACGIVVDGFIRDMWGLEEIPDYTVCARGTTPIEQNKRWGPVACNVSISLPGTLSLLVRVDAGDWIVGEDDGVVVVPKDIAMEVLVKAEDMEAREQAQRAALAAGMSLEEAYKKFQRG